MGQYTQSGPERREYAATASGKRQDRLIFENFLNDFFGEKNQSPFSMERDAVTLQTCERYLEYARRNSSRSGT